jgi:hypothetical protein
VIGAGSIRGLGESSSSGDDEAGEAKINERLEAAFVGIGLSESSAKIAARGRS